MTGAMIRPIADLGGRRQEQGRIRFGEKTANAMRALKTFRFTSPDEEAIRQIAELYGGEPKPWSDPKANPQDQWEVKTPAKTIRVFLPPGGLSCWYEKWGGKGCERRCDGVTVQLQSTRPDEMFTEADCLCTINDRMECKPKTRLGVLLPEIRMGGVWRLETASWNAAAEMPAMEAMAQQLQMYGVIEAVLSLVERSEQGGKRKFVIPRIEFASSALELLAGASTVTALAAPEPVAAIGPAGAPFTPQIQHTVIQQPADWFEQEYPDAGPDIVEAEIVSEEPLTPATEPREATITNITRTKAPAKKATAKPTADLVERAAARAKTSRSPAEKKMHAMIGEICKARDLDVDLFRHLCVAMITAGRTRSSGELEPGERDQFITTMQEVLDGERDVVMSERSVRMPKVGA